MSDLILVRGLPGSGKTSLARRMIGYQHQEADMYFEVDGTYRFESGRLPWAHAMCLRDTSAALQRGGKVVISNTFASQRELEPYLSMAANPRIIECHGRYGNVHGVEDDVIHGLASRWESTHGLFDEIDATRSPTVIDLWQEIARKNRDIAEYSLIVFSAAPPLQARLPPDATEQAIIPEVAHKSTNEGIPFWDAMLTTAWKRGLLSDALLDTVTRSYPPVFESIPLPRDEMIAEGLRRVVKVANEDKTVAMLSAVRMTTGEIRHIPMLDLRCEPNAAGLCLAWQIGQRLMPEGGVAVNSGRSLHLIGTRPVNPDQMLGVLTQSLFFCPMVDRSYVAHHLRHKACSLRVSAKGREPTVALIY